jgi:predicted pyridoxine 5'-phosphate oxidase superfamily flavin-nucleotide-binding protein
MEVLPRLGHSDAALTRRRPVDTIENVERLREAYGAPSERSLEKQSSRLDKHCRDFIVRSPFLVIVSADSSGRCDGSGSVRVIDDETLLIPDRLGNNRVDAREPGRAAGYRGTGYH